MADAVTVARPYARAAYEYAVEQKMVDAWAAMLKGLAYIAKDKRVRRYLANPELTAEQAAKVFFDIGKEAIADTKTAGKNFLLLMAENKRLLLIAEVADLFMELLAQDKALLEVNVYAAEPLSTAYKNKIKASLEQRFNKEIHLSCHTEPELIAGAVIKIDDFVIDGSALGKLQRMKNQLI